MDGLNGTIRVKASLSICVRCASAAICVAFSALAMASPADNRELPGAVAARAHLPAKKPDASCDPPNQQNGAQVKSASCLVPLSAVDKLRAGNDFTFVDVRSAAEFGRFHIADSINIPLHLVKTKMFLKNQPFVLVNEGRSTAELERVCGELKQAGFAHAAVLDEGLFGWYVAKRPLKGDPVAQSKLNRMMPAELFELHEGDASMPDWSVIDVSASGQYKNMRAWLPAKITAIPLKAKAKGDAVSKVSAAILQQRKRNPQAKLLVIADDDEAYQRIDASLKKSGIAPGVLRLESGYKGYRELVNRQVAMWKQNEQPRRYGACRG